MDNIWACEQSALERYLADHDAAVSLLLENPTMASGDDDDEEDDLDDILDIDSQGQAHIAVAGVLTQNGPNWLERIFGIAGTSYKVIHKAIKSCDANPLVKQTVLHVNSPGGSADGGLDACWQAIQESPKPCAVMVDGMMASAAYWIGSAVGPGNIHSSSPANIIGSIGVRAAILDRSDQQKAAGVKKYDFVSKNAPKKLEDPKTEAGRAEIQSQIDATERVFHARVATGRGISADYVAEKFGQGGCYVAMDPDPTQPCALSVGMVDHIASSVPLPKIAAPQAPGHYAATKTSPSPAVAGKEIQRMNLDEFLKENPDAAARVQTMLAAARSEGENAYKARAQEVGTIMAADAYKQNGVIQANGVKALSGEISLESFRGLVAMADMLSESKKLEQATTQTLPDTPPKSEAATAEADLMAKAAALKIDVELVRKSAAINRLDFANSLKAEVEFQTQLAADKARG